MSARYTVRIETDITQPRPFIVTCWDDEENEREESRERTFYTLEKARLYAQFIRDDLEAR